MSDASPPDTDTRGSGRDAWVGRLQRWLGPLLIAAATLGMMVWSWGNRPDPLVDFGRELYIPWRIQEGQVLYRDLAYFNGPFSPYWNALWLGVFGLSLRTLCLINAVWLGGLLSVLYALLVRISDRLGASVACLMVIPTFALGHLDRLGNYNYLTPYSHEATHGLGLALLSLLLLTGYRRWGRRALAAAGFAFGLCFLTKSEVTLAAGAALAAGLVALLGPGWRRGQDLRPDLRAFAGAALLPPLVAVVALSLAMPFREAVLGTLGSWPSSFDTELTGQPFYQWVMGRRDLQSNLEMMGSTVVTALLMLVPGGVVALIARRGAPFPAALGLAAFLLFAWVLSGFEPARFLPVTRAFPIYMLVMIGVFGVTVARAVMDGRRDDLAAARLAFAVLALVLMAKIILAVKFIHYGFTLAMPAAALTVVALTSWIPDWIDRRGGTGAIFRGVALAPVAIMVLSFIYVAHVRLDKRVVEFGSGADAFRITEEQAHLAEALAFVEERMEPGATLAVIPEGIMINYLARRVNPTPYVNFMPPEFIIFGDDRIVDGFRRNPPDYVMLVQRETMEYGTPFDVFGESLLTWIEANYETVHVIGDQPYRPGARTGVAIMRWATD